HFHATPKRRLRSKVTAVGDPDNAVILQADILNNLLGIVRASVVNEYDLVIHMQLLEDPDEALAHDRDRECVVITGDDCGNAFIRVLHVTFGLEMVEGGIAETFVPLGEPGKSFAQRCACPPSQLRGRLVGSGTPPSAKIPFSVWHRRKSW